MAVVAQVSQSWELARSILILTILPDFRREVVRKAPNHGDRMMKSNNSRRGLKGILCGIGLVATLSATTGCQTTIGGQTLPSPYYIEDDVQYFPPGSEFPLQKEAAQQQAYKAEAQRQGR